MKNSFGFSSRINAITCLFTRSHFRAYGVCGSSSPVFSFFRLCLPSAATEYVVQSGLAQITSGLPNHSRTCSAVNVSTSQWAFARNCLS